MSDAVLDLPASELATLLALFESPGLMVRPGDIQGLLALELVELRPAPATPTGQRAWLTPRGRQAVRDAGYSPAQK